MYTHCIRWENIVDSLLHPVRCNIVLFFFLGRQVKMAFIHTVAKPPRDVRIQQEIHGTAVQQPHQLRCRWLPPS